MKANPRWTLDVGISLEGLRVTGAPTTRIEQADARLKRAIGTRSVSGGCGFGTRDGQWEFDTEEEAEAARDRVGRAFTERELEYVSVYENDEDEEEETV
jgi:hypothetical protein